MSFYLLADGAVHLRPMRHADTALRAVSDDEFAPGLRAIEVSKPRTVAALKKGIADSMRKKHARRARE